MWKKQQLQDHLFLCTLDNDIGKRVLQTHLLNVTQSGVKSASILHNNVAC